MVVCPLLTQSDIARDRRLRPQHRRIHADQDLERLMLQFGTHFCMQKFFEFAVSHSLRQTSWHDFFYAKANAEANSKPTAATVKTFIMLLPPKAQQEGRTKSLSRRQAGSQFPAGRCAIFLCHGDAGLTDRSLALFHCICLLLTETRTSSIDGINIRFLS